MLYETPIFTYSKELDVIVLTGSITISDLEEESSPPYSKDVVIDSKKGNDKFKKHHSDGYTIIWNGFQ